MRTRLVAALLPTIFLVGCLQSTTVVKVNADGSGTLENQTVMTSAALVQMRQLTGALRGADAQALDPFSEDQARAIAAQMGDGVTLLSTAPIKTTAAEGRYTVYAFRDITKLRVSQAPAPPGGASIRGGGIDLGGDRNAMVTIDLDRTPAGNVLMTLHTPGDPLSALFSQIGPASRRGGPVPGDQMVMMRQMLAGMRIALRVEPMGRVVRSNSPYVDGQTVTLFDVDVDSLLKNEEAFARLQAASTPAETAAALANVPGVKIAAERDITIEFAPR
jgi:hypothetical protein